MGCTKRKLNRWATKGRRWRCKWTLTFLRIWFTGVLIYFPPTKKLLIAIYKSLSLLSFSHLREIHFLELLGIQFHANQQALYIYNEGHGFKLQFHSIVQITSSSTKGWNSVFLLLQLPKWIQLHRPNEMVWETNMKSIL